MLNASLSSINKVESKIVIMGEAIGKGNISPAAEFNVYLTHKHLKKF